MRVRRSTTSLLLALALVSAGAVVAVASAPATAQPATATTTGQYHPAWVRLADRVEVEPGDTRAVKVAGVGSLPATGLESVTVNVAAKGLADAGSIVVYPTGETEPATVAVHYQPTHYASTTVLTGVGTDGQIQVVNQGVDKVSLYLDVHGYTLARPTTGGLHFVDVPQSRVLPNTTLGGGILGGNLELQPLGKGGVPAQDVQAVALTLVSKSQSNGTLRVYPSGEGFPADATTDYVAGIPQQNFVIAKVGANGKVNVHNLGGGSVDVAVDVVGYLTSASTAANRATLRTVPPTRITEKLLIPAGTTKVVDPRGQGGLPVHNLTSVGVHVSAISTGSGTVQVHPSGAANPGGQTVGYVADKDASGFTLPRLGADGKIALHNAGSATAAVEVDVYAYAELVNRTFPIANSPGEAIENITGTADLTTATTSDEQNIAVNSVTDDGGTTTVKIPRDAASGLTITSDAGTMTIGLPAVGAATRTTAGTVVYQGDSGRHSIGVQPTADGGFRTFAHLADASAPTSYAFPMTLPEGTALAVDEWDGSAILVREGVIREGEVEIDAVGRIQKPWARDAQGRSWPTRYTVEGAVLRLHVDITPVVDATGATVTPAFPVVADPWIKRNCGIVTCSWYFSKSATVWLKRRFDSLGWKPTVAISAICGFLSHPVARAACNIALNHYYWSAFDNVKRAYNRGGCFVVRAGIHIVQARSVRFDNVPLSNRYCYRS
ncbi:hypothetical protein [Saccharothrix deserti]|uniref:hypothetical protein n=1 Tax=Saccharothrix deserti TaxID=2593674 RepID=UPI00131E5D02|nr:hypothetical protein [Saccharothrix deserti]